LRGREGFGFLSLPPSLRGEIRRFYGSETSFFHCAGGKVSDAGSEVTGRVRWLTLGAAQLDGCTSASDGLTSDAG
jgi:hypothetical protein